MPTRSSARTLHNFERRANLTVYFAGGFPFQSVIILPIPALLPQIEALLEGVLEQRPRAKTWLRKR